MKRTWFLRGWRHGQRREKKSPYITGSKGKLIDYGMIPVLAGVLKILLKECEGTMEEIRSYPKR
jgi:hypothetical protein